jgi:hypothetical protein
MTSGGGSAMFEARRFEDDDTPEPYSELFEIYEKMRAKDTF